MASQMFRDCNPRVVCCSLMDSSTDSSSECPFTEGRAYHTCRNHIEPHLAEQAHGSDLCFAACASDCGCVDHENETGSYPVPSSISSRQSYGHSVSSYGRLPKTPLPKTSLPRRCMRSCPRPNSGHSSSGHGSLHKTSLPRRSVRTGSRPASEHSASDHGRLPKTSSSRRSARSGSRPAVEHSAYGHGSLPKKSSSRRSARSGSRTTSGSRPVSDPTLSFDPSSESSSSSGSDNFSGWRQPPVSGDEPDQDSGFSPSSSGSNLHSMTLPSVGHKTSSHVESNPEVGIDDWASWQGNSEGDPSDSRNGSSKIKSEELRMFREETLTAKGIRRRTLFGRKRTLQSHASHGLTNRDCHNDPSSFSPFDWFNQS